MAQTALSDGTGAKWTFQKRPAKGLLEALKQVIEQAARPWHRTLRVQLIVDPAPA
jgi:hypothetical protein